MPLLWGYKYGVPETIIIVGGVQEMCPPCYPLLIKGVSMLLGNDVTEVKVVPSLLVSDVPSFILFCKRPYWL